MLSMQKLLYQLFMNILHSVQIRYYQKLVKSGRITRKPRNYPIGEIK